MIYIVFICSFLFSSSNEYLLFEMYSIIDWEHLQISDDKNIYEAESDINNYKFIKIEKDILKDEEVILNNIQSIENWNEIISNKNIETKLLSNNNDTLVVLQTISNAIPFTKNRIYIFKLFKVNPNRIDWYLTADYNNFLEDYMDNNDYLLSSGAGSWQIKKMGNKNKLIYRLYLDDEVNLSSMIIQKLRINYAVNIFNDMLTYQTGEK